MTTKKLETNEKFGYMILRDHVLSDILGKNENDVLYWAGKSLARKFPLHSLDEAINFFSQADFGGLIIEKSGKSETVFMLQPDTISNRCFKLEAGFLAQQEQELSGFLTEAYDEVLLKKKMVRITLKTDLREHV